MPFDYNDPSKGEFDLFLARHLADPKQRIGSLLVNPGGPGFGGTDLAFSASNIYNKTLLDHFDIVYHLSSLAKNQTLVLKARADHRNAVVPSEIGRAHV